MKKRIKKLNVMIISPEDGKTYNFTISSLLVKTVIISNALLLILLIIMGFLYQKYIPKSGYITKLEKENKILKQQIAGFSDKIDMLNKKIENLNSLTTKLRIMANLNIKTNKDEGVGGPSFEEVNNFIDLNEVQDENIKKLHYAIDKLKFELAKEDKNIKELFNYLKVKSIKLSSTPSIMPAEGWISSPFGYRRDPFTGRRRFHEGIDISNRPGTPVIAPADGIVVFTGREGGYGKLIVISHGYGISTRYGHLRKIFVKPGQKVQRGDIIGEIGNTGRSTGPHLHYEVRIYGKPVNPINYILN